MGDSLPGLFRRRLRCFTAARPGRGEAAKPAFRSINHPKIHVGKLHQPVARLGFRYANRLANQCLADEHRIAAPLDLSVQRTRRTAWSALYHGSSTRSG